MIFAGGLQFKQLLKRSFKKIVWQIWFTLSPVQHQASILAGVLNPVFSEIA